MENLIGIEGLRRRTPSFHCGLILNGEALYVTKGAASGEDFCIYWQNTIW